MEAMLFGDPDSAEMTDAMYMAAQTVYSSIPAPPVDTAAPLALAAAAAAVPGGDGVDRVSDLPADILADVVARLPAGDAARAAALSRRWRRVWRSVPPALVDLHLLRAPPADDARLRRRRGSPYDGLAAAVSGALAAHPGPFRCVYLTAVPLDAYHPSAARWLELLAAKGVERLVVVNRPAPPSDAYPPLPAALFACASLTSLYLGFCALPAAAAAAVPAFPNLVELGLCSLAMSDGELALLLRHCPALEKLAVVRSRSPLSVAVAGGGALRCVQVCASFVPEMALLHAPRLERLLLWEAWGVGLAAMRSRVRIEHAPALRCIGFLVPGMHELEIGTTVIKVGTEPGPGTTVPSVRMLAVRVKLGASNEVTMLPSFLRCFPNVETLYVQSENNDGEPPLGPQFGSFSSGELDVDGEFWDGVGRPIECVQRRINKLVFRGFRGDMSELSFLKFVAKHAKALESMVIVTESCHGGDPDLAVAQLMSVMAGDDDDAAWGSPACKVTALPSPSPLEGTPWCFVQAFDLAIQDPFDFSKCAQGNCRSP
ncbi:hypothetical protein ACP4OV_018343 [Aristida adscensionis]